MSKGKKVVEKTVETKVVKVVPVKAVVEKFNPTVNYDGKPVVIVRPANGDDNGWAEDIRVNQILIEFEDGTQVAVPETDVTNF